MKPEDLLKELEKIYGWDLLKSEQIAMIGIARSLGAGETIKKWTEYQEKFPGHSVKKFRDTFVADKGIPFW